jgi:hypothetical protein
MRFRFLPTVLAAAAGLAVGYTLGRRSDIAPPENHAVSEMRVTATRSEKTSQPVASEFRWGKLESPDYFSYIARLRQVGCPEQTLRDIIVADICNLYSREWKKKFLAAKPDYWNPDYGLGPIQSEEVQKAASQVQAVLRQNVQALLKVDLDNELEKFRAIGTTQLGEEFLLGNLMSPEKASAVVKSLKRQQSARQSIENAGFLTFEGVLALKRLREEMRHELGAFLSSEEMAQVDENAVLKMP